jgi:iron-sulfur cluster repair protein YtfE (RIC family)
MGEMVTNEKLWADFRPIDIVRCFHNAFRRDTKEIDEAALMVAKSRGREDFTLIMNRFQITGEILDYHAKGEEEAVFPAVEALAPLISKPYITDHRELDRMVAELDSMRTTADPLSITRATAVLNSQLRIHLYKEDSHLYPILRERNTLDEQVKIVGLMSRKVPPDKMPTLVNWLFPLLGQGDRVVMVKGWMNLMPPQAFANLKPLIHDAIDKDWVDLTRRVPELV